MGKYSSRSDLSLFQCLKVKQCRCAGSGSSFSFIPYATNGFLSQSISVLGRKLEIIFECFLVVRI